MMKLLISRVLDHRLAHSFLQYIAIWHYIELVAHASISLLCIERPRSMRSLQWQVALLMCEIFINKNVLSGFAFHSISTVVAFVIIEIAADHDHHDHHHAI